MVELRTVYSTRYYTDSNGVVAFYEPGMMNDQQVFFHVRSHGYEFPKDSFGYSGRILTVREGGSAELKIRRINIAQRLYRITGIGIYADSVLLGDHVPLRNPLIDGKVTGQDTVLAAVWQGKIFWFWGDTNQPRYPLGLYQTSGATSLLPRPAGQVGNLSYGLDPSQGIDLEYFVNADGFTRKMCPMPGTDVVWLDGLIVVPDEVGREQMVAHYTRRKGMTEAYEHGIVVFDEKTQTFANPTVFDPKDQRRCPHGHAFRVREQDTDYYLFASPFAVMRVKADLAHVAQQASYDAFTCLTPGSRYAKGKSSLERSSDGRLVYGWKRDTDPIGTIEEWALISAGKIQPEEVRYQVEDIEGRRLVTLHGGSIRWNEFRKKWIMIAVQSFGKNSLLGDVWFTESDSPTGPWHGARRIATHDKYSFYNPVHHAFLDQDGGRVIYFEGTYASTFSGNVDQTPRYDYNQIMYSLDLADPRLAPAALSP